MSIRPLRSNFQEMLIKVKRFYSRIRVWKCCLLNLLTHIGARRSIILIALQTKAKQNAINRKPISWNMSYASKTDIHRTEIFPSIIHWRLFVICIPQNMVNSCSRTRFRFENQMFTQFWTDLPKAMSIRPSISFHRTTPVVFSSQRFYTWFSEHTEYCSRLFTCILSANFLAEDIIPKATQYTTLYTE